MSAAPAVPRSCTPSFWVGDPAILVFAVRYALSVRGGHAPEFVRQALEANAGVLPAAARQLIVRDITTWLNHDGAEAPAAVRAGWVAALAALGVHG